MTSARSSELQSIRSPALDRRRTVDETAAKDARAQKWAHLRPHSATIYVENKCNLKCAHCYESEDTHPSDEYAMSLDDYARLFDELAALGTLSLTITGGEIFLRRDLLDIVELARKKRFAVTLFTSGTLIDEKKADRIAALKMKSVEITVYSHDAAVHDRFTGIPRSHEKSVRALRLLRERGVKTLMKANLTTFNVDHIDEMIALARSLDADFTFDPTVKPRMNGDRSPLQFALSPDELRRKVFSRPDLYTAFKKYQPSDLCTGTSTLIPDDSALCSAAQSGLSISADGGVYACGFFPEAGGHLRDGPLKDTWYGSPQFDRVRETTFEKMSSCGSCGVKSTCSPCMAYSLVEHQDHTACSTPSLQLATAIHMLAEQKVAKNAQMERGKPLPLVGDTEVLRPPLKGGAAALSSE